MIALDTEGGHILVRGWQEKLRLRPEEVIPELLEEVCVRIPVHLCGRRRHSCVARIFPGSGRYAARRLAPSRLLEAFAAGLKFALCRGWYGRGRRHGALYRQTFPGSLEFQSVNLSFQSADRQGARSPSSGAGSCQNSGFVDGNSIPVSTVLLRLVPIKTTRQSCSFLRQGICQQRISGLSLRERSEASRAPRLHSRHAACAPSSWKGSFSLSVPVDVHGECRAPSDGFFDDPELQRHLCEAVSTALFPREPFGRASRRRRFYSSEFIIASDGDWGSHNKIP